MGEFACETRAIDYPTARVGANPPLRELLITCREPDRQPRRQRMVAGAGGELIDHPVGTVADGADEFLHQVFEGDDADRVAAVVDHAAEVAVGAA